MCVTLSLWSRQSIRNTFRIHRRSHILYTNRTANSTAGTKETGKIMMRHSIHGIFSTRNLITKLQVISQQQQLGCEKNIIEIKPKHEIIPTYIQTIIYVSCFQFFYFYAKRTFSTFPRNLRVAELLLINDVLRQHAVLLLRQFRRSINALFV